MMTGVEIAGLVLAILPLVISALEHYGEGTKPLRDFVKYKATVRALICNLATQRALFRNTLERLLCGIVDGEIKLALLLNNPGGPEWHKEELAQGLRNRLQHSADIYMESILEMQNLLQTLKEHIGLDDKGQPTWFDRPTHKKAWKKFKVCLARKDHELLIQRMEQSNKNLSSLTTDSLDLEPLRLNRQKAKEPFKIVRDCLRCLHSVLKRSWLCACRSPHSAELQLEIRDHQSSPSFRVMFPCPENFQEGQTTSLPWQKTTIRPLKIPKTPSAYNSSWNTGIYATTEYSQISSSAHDTNVNLVSSSFSYSIIGGPGKDQKKIAPPPAGSERRKSKRVAWAKPQAKQEICKDDAQNRPQDEIRTLNNVPLISDLCQIFKTVPIEEQQTQKCLGYLTENDQSLGIYYIGAKPSPSLTQSQPLNLESLLCSHGQVRSRPEEMNAAHFAKHLTKKQRLRLAAVLASNLLQLSGTPWLQQPWSRKDILFHDGPDESPYVSKIFQRCNDGIPELANLQVEPSWTPIRNRSIFDLGVILLELSYGKPLLEFKTSKDPSTFTEFAIAGRLADQMLGEEFPGYADAVRACIRCDLGSKVKVTSFDNDAFRQAVYDEIVNPLERDWKYWNGITD